MMTFLACVVMIGVTVVFVAFAYLSRRYESVLARVFFGHAWARRNARISLFIAGVVIVIAVVFCVSKITEAVT